MSATTPPWPAPDRPAPPRRAGERVTLEAFLDDQRLTLLRICAGLGADDLARRACPPSTLSLLGLLRHLTEVERYWFVQVLDGRPAPGPYSTPDRPDADLDDAEPSAAAEALPQYLQTLEQVRGVAAGHGLDDRGRRREAEVDLRWIYLHLIEEYARHNGHADLLRESIDGTTGC